MQAHLPPMRLLPELFRLLLTKKEPSLSTRFFSLLDNRYFLLVCLARPAATAFVDLLERPIHDAHDERQ